MIDLPQSNTVRWNASKKFAVITAINIGLLSVNDAIKRYSLSTDELRVWSERLRAFGPLGLHATAAKKYRDKLKGVS